MSDRICLQPEGDEVCARGSYVNEVGARCHAIIFRDAKDPKAVVYELIWTDEDYNPSGGGWYSSLVTAVKAAEYFEPNMAWE